MIAVVIEVAGLMPSKVEKRLLSESQLYPSTGMVSQDLLNHLAIMLAGADSRTHCSVRQREKTGSIPAGRAEWS
ncbi:hypothetical protein A6X21_14810 [Planctopirus hydrillae]|uniref:Uncharacterized protein n=1 Tax=Planctopirus hydrillae TaxID=1841610 RepID=A0A1C3E4M2_9PLAN|nr:hypothetical protein A6X21_14810 [Planctopirus hydrillae]